MLNIVSEVTEFQSVDPKSKNEARWCPVYIGTRWHFMFKISFVYCSHPVYEFCRLVWINWYSIELARCLELSNSPGYPTPQKGHVRYGPCELYIQGWHRLNKPMIDISMISHAKWHACYQLTLFPLGRGHGVSLHIQIISFQIWIELHGWKLYDNIISGLLHIWEE